MSNEDLSMFMIKFTQKNIFMDGRRGSKWNMEK